MHGPGRRLRSGRMQHFVAVRLATAAFAALVLLVPAAVLLQRSGAAEARVDLGRSLQVERVGSTTCFVGSGRHHERYYPRFPSGWTLTADWAFRDETGVLVGDPSGDVVVSAAGLDEHRTSTGCRGPGRVVRVLAVVVPERGPGFSAPTGVPVPKLPH